MTDSIYQYVLTRLQGTNTREGWQEISDKTGIPVSTIKKIARREVHDPGVSKIETLARYFRSLDSSSRSQRVRATAVRA